MALEIRKYGGEKRGGKDRNCPEEPGHMILGYMNYRPELATPAQLTQPFPWHFSLHFLASAARTLPVPCCGDKAFSFYGGFRCCLLWR